MPPSAGDLHFPDLWSEWIDAVRLADRAGVVEMLADFGVSRDVITAAGWVGMAHIRKLNGGYEPGAEADVSRLALISPQLDGTTLVGLVAWHPLHPGRVYPRMPLEPGTGLLGEGPYPSWGEALTVHASPLSWLLSGCDGVVVLDWQHAALALPLQAVRPADEDAAARLRAAGVRYRKAA